MKGILVSLVKKLDLLCVQTEMDGERFSTFGADREKITVLGNLKFDLLQYLAMERGSKPTRSSFGISPEAKVIVAGSTRPGEEKIWLSAFKQIANKMGKVVLILAPRHLDRIAEIESLLTMEGLAYSKRSQIDVAAAGESGGIILLDTMGELLQVYSFADVAFVGGTLASFGGHNPLEPAMWGIPVLFGPHRDNIRDISNLLLQEGGCIEVTDDGDISETVLHLLQHSDERRMRGEAARRVVEANAGVARKTAQLLQERGTV
jgi:3-deoxy-D-manno-octulosonic-acid transferase